jgi:hypothetical protein
MARRETENVSDAEIDLVQGDFLCWDTEERFDLIVAMGLFDYVSNPGEALERMRLLCRNTVIASFPSRHWLRTPIRRVRYAYKRCPVFFYDHGMIKRLGQDAGFAACKITKIKGAGMDYIGTFEIGNPG